MISLVLAIVVLTGWLALVEFDQYPESERNKIFERIRKSPAAIITIALMPVGIIIHTVGGVTGSLVAIVIGATLIYIQSIIVALLFWKKKRWKSILLFSTMIILGIFTYVQYYILFA